MSNELGDYEVNFKSSNGDTNFTIVCSNCEKYHVLISIITQVLDTKSQYYKSENYHCLYEEIEEFLKKTEGKLKKIEEFEQ